MSTFATTTPTPMAKTRQTVKSAAVDNACCHNTGTSPSPPFSPSHDSASSKSYLYAALMGLLSSSCCIIQLVLNAFSIGCAGFSVLTPFRPYFVTLSVAMIVYNIVQYGRSRPVQTLITVLIVATLSLTPELVSHTNQGGHLLPASSGWSSIPSFSSPLGPWGAYLPFWSSSISSASHESELAQDAVAHPPSQSVSCSKDTSSPAVFDAVPKHQHQHAPISLDVFKVRVEGMKCEACANRLQRAFLAQPGVQKCAVFFQDKHLYLWTTSPASKDEASWTESQIKEVIAQVDFKYRATLLAQGSAVSTDDTVAL